MKTPSTSWWSAAARRAPPRPTRLAQRGHSVLLLDRAGRIKPCGGAIPPRLIKDFAIPDHLLVARATSARMISPSDVKVDIPIEGGFVGMVDRDTFDEWLRERAAGRRGAPHGHVSSARARRGRPPRGALRGARDGAARDGQPQGARALRDRRRRRALRGGAPGVPGADRHRKFVFAYHEILRAPRRPRRLRRRRAATCTTAARCRPTSTAGCSRTATMSVGHRQRRQGLLAARGGGRAARAAGLGPARRARREGAPIPLKPLPRWDNGRDVVLAGDAAGVVAPASGEGIYYAMVGGRWPPKRSRCLPGQRRQAAPTWLARKRFMRAHGRVFWVLGIMQRFWYSSDKRRERFVSICRTATCSS
jgi:geranylgeranyl reductase